MRAFEIPEHRDEQIRWLESELLGTQVLQLVAELESLHGEVRQFAPLSDQSLEAIRERGLTAMTDAQFEHLLSHPRAIVPLQQDVLERGGLYWSRVEGPSDAGTHPKKPDWSQLARVRAAERTSAPAPKPSRFTPLVWATCASLATAAALLLVLRPAADKRDFAEVPRPVAESVWGFEKFADRPADSDAQLSPSRDAYFRGLASAAETWMNRRPATREELARRIGEFRMGCSRILLSSHPPLDEEDRSWLHEHCQSWASALDRHLAETEAGDDMKKIIERVDLTAVKIAAALLGRADSAKG